MKNDHLDQAEEFEAEIQEAFNNNKDRPDLFVKHLQEKLQMSEFDIVKQLERYDRSLLSKYYVYITKAESAPAV